MVKAATKPIVKKEEDKFRNQQFPDVAKVVDTNMLCTSCNCSVKQLVLRGNPKAHPFLDTLLCEKCFNFFGDGDFSVDEDGSDKYCRWCGQGGTLYLCSKCTAGFCKKCIKRNLPRSILKDVEEDDWECLCCNVKPLYELRATCWAAMKLAKGKSDLSSRKRKGRKDVSDTEGSDSSLVETSKKRSKADESSDEEKSKESRRTSNRKPKKAKKEVKVSSDEEADEDVEDQSQEKSPKHSPRTPSRRSRRTEKTENSSDEGETPSKKSPKSKRKSKRTSSRENGDEVASSKDKLEAKQWKLARSKMSTVLQDLIKLNTITQSKATVFKKNKVTAQKVNDLKSFHDTAGSITSFLLSVENMTKKLRDTFSEFATKLEETVAAMAEEKCDENGLQTEENGDTASKDDKMDVEEPDLEKSSKETEEVKQDDDVEVKDDDDEEVKEDDDAEVKDSGDKSGEEDATKDEETEQMGKEEDGEEEEAKDSTPPEETSDLSADAPEKLGTEHDESKST